MEKIDLSKEGEASLPPPAYTRFDKAAQELALQKKNEKKKRFLRYALILHGALAIAVLILVINIIVRKKEAEDPDLYFVEWKGDVQPPRPHPQKPGWEIVTESEKTAEDQNQDLENSKTNEAIGHKEGDQQLPPLGPQIQPPAPTPKVIKIVDPPKTHPPIVIKVIPSSNLDYYNNYIIGRPSEPEYNDNNDDDDDDAEEEQENEDEDSSESESESESESDFATYDSASNHYEENYKAIMKKFEKLIEKLNKQKSWLDETFY